MSNPASPEGLVPQSGMVDSRAEQHLRTRAIQRLADGNANGTRLLEVAVASTRPRYRPRFEAALARLHEDGPDEAISLLEVH